MKAVIGIGMPGCGKTTLFKPLAEKEGLVYVNVDDIREEVTGDPRDHSSEVQVWKEAYDRIKAALQDKGVVVDATHSKRKDRIGRVNYCREHGAQWVIGYWFKTPLKVCLERNYKRRRIVPGYAIESMHNRLRLNPPSQEEGFDQIIEVEGD